MNANATGRVSRRELMSGLVYAVIVVGAGGIILDVGVSLATRWQSLNDQRQLLAQLDRRANLEIAAAPEGQSRPAGSPFLDGATFTVAGASLQQRIDGAIAGAGGALISSQVDLNGSQAKNGFVTLTATLELPQPALQSMLYDLEAGMPYLFVDRLAIEAPQISGGADGGRLRATLTVSSQWRSAP